MLASAPSRARGRRSILFAFHPTRNEEHMTKQQEADARELEAELAASREGARAASAQSGLYRVRVAGVSGEDVVVELNPRVQGVVPLAEFETPPAVGSTLEVALTGKEEGGLWSFSVQHARKLAAWSEVEVGALVKGTVIGMNKGGLELRVAGARGFLPSSQIALQHVEDLASFAGQTLVCEVLEVDRERRSLVLSRRSVLEEELREQRGDSLSGLHPGARARGKVKRLESYGAFVEVAPGVEGLLHVSNLSHRRVERPDELLKLGQELEVVVLEVSPDGKRIGLGRKQLEEDPWDAAAARLRPGSVLQGTVRRLAEFGAFVEVEPGLEGLLHVSQLGQGRVKSPREVLKVGQELSVRIVSLDPRARRLSLSRLDERGALLGSEEAAEGAEIEAALREGDAPLGQSLGALFKRALRKDGA